MPKIWLYFTWLIFLVVTKNFIIEATDNSVDINPEDFVWFIRKFDCPHSNCTKNFDSWKKEKFEEIETELLNENKIISKNLWIPLNGIDSLQIETNWREWKNKTNNCVKDCPTPKVHYLLDGLYRAILIDDYGYLQPIYWENSTILWLLLRSEWVYEVPYPPPVMYFMNMDANTEMEKFYQPFPFSLHSHVKFCFLCILKKNPLKYSYSNKKSNIEHLIFVVHGIGQHEGEEGVVKNAYSIRKGFIKYLKKFHPTFKIPYIIPVAWRHNLTLNDDTLRVTPLTKNDFVKSVGFILSDVFYHLSDFKKDILDNLFTKLNDTYILFKSHNPNFSGNVSILAHSLGSVLTFDLINTRYEELPFEIENIFLIGSPLGRFLATNGTKAEQLNQNQWIENGTLFNILHSDDPVAHRLEVLFNVNYSYTAPANLFFHKEFRTYYDKSIKIDEIEDQEVESFHRYINDDRAMALSHDSFLTVDYLAYGFELDSQHFNVCDINEMFKGKLEFLRGIFFNKKIRNDTQIVHFIPPEKRIKHRYDFDLYRTGLAENGGSDSNFLLETEFIQWMKEFSYSHTSYWNRPEVIALMTNVIFNYVPEKKYEGTISPYDNETFVNSHKTTTRTHGFAWRAWKSFNHLLCWIALFLLMRCLDPQLISKMYDDCVERNFTWPLKFLITIIGINMISMLLNLIPDIITYITLRIVVLIFSLGLIFSESLSNGNAGRQRILEGIQMEDLTSVAIQEELQEQRPFAPHTTAMPQVSTNDGMVHRISEYAILIVLDIICFIIFRTSTIFHVFWHVIVLGVILLTYFNVYRVIFPQRFTAKYVILSFKKVKEKVINAKTIKLMFFELFKFIWNLFGVGSILFILLCSQNIVTDLGVRSLTLVFLLFYMLPHETQQIQTDCKHFGYFRERNTDECKEKERQKAILATQLPIRRISFAETADQALYESYNWKIIRKACAIFRHILQLIICVGICLLLLFVLPSPDTLAEVGWNFRSFLNEVFPKLNLSKWWIHSIYVLMFIPPILNFVITEKRYNLQTIYRIVYNFVMVLTALWWITYEIKKVFEKIRDYDLECVHSDIKGFCREYIMYNNVTNEHVGLRTDDEEPPSLW